MQDERVAEKKNEKKNGDAVSESTCNMRTRSRDAVHQPFTAHAHYFVLYHHIPPHVHTTIRIFSPIAKKMDFIPPEDRAYMSPSSSPGGSPTASSFVDSSPLSSPSLQPLDLGRPATPLGISHPFSGSTHATAHPSNELRYSNSSYTPATWSYRSGISSSEDHPKVFEAIFNEEEESFSTSSYDPEPPDEAALWEEKITRAVDMGEAEFTWKYVPVPSLPVATALTSPQGIQGSPLYLHLSWNSIALVSYPSRPSGLSSACRPHQPCSPRRTDRSFHNLFPFPGRDPRDL